MDVTVTGAAGANASANDPGTDGLPGASASAVADSSTDTANSANATGGAGGTGSAGADAPLGFTTGGGRGGNGSYGGDATASAVTSVASSSSTSAGARATGGQGGGGAQGGYPTGQAGVGDVGGNVTNTSAVDDNAAGGASAGAFATGGTGGAPSEDLGVTDNAGYHGAIYVGSSGGTVSNTSASATGTSFANAYVSQTGGAGGDGGRGGVGTASSLVNAVTGATNDGTLDLSQTATGGAGGGGDASTGGQGGDATSDLSFDDTQSATQSASINVDNTATAGAAGIGATGGVEGVDASASTSITGANNVSVTEYSGGGVGGSSGSYYVGNAGGDAGNGGAADASGSAATTSATGTVSVNINAIGGAGGNAEDGAGSLAIPSNGGDGGQATIGTVSGTGGSAAYVEATLTGGSGGSSDGALGGTGADATLTNGVTGSTQGGSLQLFQTVNAGAGGKSFGGTGGHGGNATSNLTFDDTANASQSSALTVDIQAQAGQGGFDDTDVTYGTDQTGSTVQLSGDGGAAVANGAVTASNAATVDLSVTASGNRGTDGGNATANATASGGTVNVNADAEAGGGTSVFTPGVERAGTAVATAVATDAGGFDGASAGSSLLNPFGNATSTISATTYTTVAGTDTARSIAGYDQTGVYDTNSQAVSTDIGRPTASMGAPALDPSLTLLMDAEQGGGSAVGATGTQTTTSTLSTMIDLTGINTGSQLMVDFNRATLVGDGVTGVTFKLAEYSNTFVNETFTSGAAAAAFFDNQVIDYGSFSALTGGADSISLTMSLTVTTDAPGSGFYAEVEAAGTACYCPGTLIRTGRGHVAIEDLRVGDPVATLHGGVQPVKWIGRRSYDGRFVAGKVLMLPVCIKRGAIARGVPARDLWVSPGHALYVDGVLVPAWLLVNGKTITQAEAVDSVTYLHVEFDNHEIIFAEGCTAESFVDDKCRGQFHNAAEYHALYPNDPAGPPPLCAVRVEDGFVLQAIQRRLAVRARLRPARATTGPLRGFVDQAGPEVISGWAQDMAQPELPVCLDVLVGGRRVKRVLANHYRADLRQAGLGSGKHAFELLLPPGCSGAVEIRRSADQSVLGLTDAAAARHDLRKAA